MTSGGAAATSGSVVSLIISPAYREPWAWVDVRSVDSAGNTGPATPRTWTVDATGPTIGTIFPTTAGQYNDTTYDAGCVTATGDICGTTSDTPSGVATVEISLQRASTGLYLSGTTFSSADRNWITTTGTTEWSHILAGSTFPADDTYTLTVRATDTVGNAASTSTAFTIDRTRPTASDFTTTNTATVRKLDPGDTFTLTYSEPIAPSSIIAGWDGTTAQNVVVRASGSGNRKDRLTIHDATNTTQLPLGSLNLNRTDYVSGGSAMTFGLTGTRSTITTTGSSLTITLGTPSRNPGTASAAANVIWTPATGVADRAGNTATTTSYTETDLDNDF